MAKNAEDTQFKPTELRMVKDFMLSVKMPGHMSAVVTQHYKDGTRIRDAETIARLVDVNAPYEVIK